MNLHWLDLVLVSFAPFPPLCFASSDSLVVLERPLFFSTCLFVVIRLLALLLYLVVIAFISLIDNGFPRFNAIVLITVFKLTPDHRLCWH